MSREQRRGAFFYKGKKGIGRGHFEESNSSGSLEEVVARQDDNHLPPVGVGEQAFPVCSVTSNES